MHYLCLILNIYIESTKVDFFGKVNSYVNFFNKQLFSLYITIKLQAVNHQTIKVELMTTKPLPQVLQNLLYNMVSSISHYLLSTVWQIQNHKYVDYQVNHLYLHTICQMALNLYEQPKLKCNSFKSLRTIKIRMQQNNVILFRVF